MAASRAHPAETTPMPTGSSAPVNYLPSQPTGVVGAVGSGGGDRSPFTRRTEYSQVLGSVVGRRGAGISAQAGGDQFAHSMNHYGKNGLPGLEGSDSGVDMGGIS